MDNGGCDHDCAESSDGLSRTCSCLKGYKLHDNFKQCVPTGDSSLVAGSAGGGWIKSRSTKPSLSVLFCRKLVLRSPEDQQVVLQQTSRRPAAVDGGRGGGQEGGESLAGNWVSRTDECKQKALVRLLTSFGLSVAAFHLLSFLSS